MRQLKPHSLSYQANTLTKLPPRTIVACASKAAEDVLWLKSDEATGSSVYVNIPFSWPSDAFLKAALISSFVVFFSSMHVKSTMETFGTGTRRAIPFIFPASSGSTSVAATAAPVVGGMMFIAPGSGLGRAEG